MTSNELIAFLNNTYGLKRPWPKKLKVDADTYANCCQTIFNYHGEIFPIDEGIKILSITCGPNDGLMFKNVELILESK